MEENKIPKKVRMTLYMTKEDEQLLYEVFIARLKRDKKTDRSALLCESIKLLHEKEAIEMNSDKQSQ